MEGAPTPGRGRPKGRGRAVVDPVEVKSEDVPPTEAQPDPDVSEAESAERAVEVSSGIEDLVVGSPKEPSVRGRRGPEAYLRTRPSDPNFTKEGTTGGRIALIANYFLMQKKKSFRVNQYRVDYEPDYEDAIVRKGIFHQFKEKLPMYIFDGTVLYCQETLSPELSKFETQDKREPDKTVVITIRFIKTLEPEDAGMIQFHNIVLRTMMSGLKLTLLGRHYYDADLRIDKPTWRLELWPGFMTSLRTCDGKQSLLNVEVTHKVIRTDTVIHMLNQIRLEHANSPDEERQKKMDDAVAGRIVMTRYNRKTYKVQNIDWGSTPKSTFDQKKTGKSITFMEYYEEVYKLRIASPGQPLLRAEPRKQDIHRDGADPKPILLVPELCFITGLDEEQRGNFQLTRDLAEHLHMPPGKRVDAITNLIHRVTDSEKVRTDLEKWGVRFTPDPVTIPGRVLPPEKLLFRSKNGERQDVPASGGDWSRSMRDVQMYSCVDLNKWVVIVPSRTAEGVDNLVRTLMRVSTPLNFNLAHPEVIRITNPSAQAYITAINGVMNDKKGDIQLFFVILGNNRLDIYSAIKQRISIEYGIISQCFLAKNVNNKGLMSIATKVAIQMNAKLGGEPWAVVNPLKNLMVIGFDVYHGGGSSIGCMSATIKGTLARYFSTVTKFNSKIEISDKIAAPFGKCLKAFQHSNGVLPERIMFYRDGVGEGQLKYVYQVELQQILNLLTDTYGKDNVPKLSFIIVTKRINTRFMTVGGGVNNPPPGTVVDSVVTFPERYDFYLIPQSARQGTVSPVSYNVLYDTSGLPPDKIQIFSFKLCHLYFNWSGTVTVPAACQYAHKLAYLTGLSLKRPASNKLDFLLHYL